ncbi:hypothetical protein CTheo_5184 [Ceratobasidium theobromae]|uniref:Peptidase S1 domain-containing protein n=1 Tax=Ceratobasidium theobromae TaxID=1582974 RepID=A0A5N5QHZ2_9AGAM|nr:hypothetical protein CTheo_5184 [Ceratobasidium theobromae]
MLVSLTAATFSSKAGIVQKTSQLTKFYKFAYMDFYGSGTLCIYKTGPSWPIHEGIEEQKYIQAACPIYNHRIRPTWLSIAWRIVTKLDSLQVEWNTINPLVYANAGKADLICDFVIMIGVKPGSLAYDAAVAAATAVDEILQATGFPEIQIAFIKSVYHHHGNNPRLMNFNPLLDSIPALRKAFTHVPSISIAPLASPHFEGTGSLFFCLSSEDDHVALLTCAHITHPPPLFCNNTYTQKNDSQPREDVIFLGTKAFNAAIKALTKFTTHQTLCIEGWGRKLGNIGSPEKEEPIEVTSRHKELTGLIEIAKNKIKAAEDLYADVTKFHAHPEQRVFGCILHVEKIEVGTGDHKFTTDWSFILLDHNMVDWKNFLGNKLFIGAGGAEETNNWADLMFPQPHDSQKYQEPKEDLLQIKGVVPESEFHSPQDYDINNNKTLLAVKNGRSTGTTYGFTQIHCPWLQHIKFSDPGDSGAIVVGRDGHVIGILTGGGGPTDETDKTYITPYFWLEK